MEKNKIFNNQLQVELQKAIATKKLTLKYPKKYKRWKEKFDYWHNKTKDVRQALKIMYGPNGSVTNYQGSLYNNSNFDIKQIRKIHQKRINKVKKPSNIFNYLKIKQKRR